MSSAHREILVQPAVEQDASPLYSVLPGEVRAQIFAFALTDYPDPSPKRQYSPDTCFARPSYYAPRKTDTQLLRTCRAIYKECWHLPFTLKEQMYWITASDRAPPEFRRAGPSLREWLKGIAELQGEDKVVIDKLRVFAQMYKLEEGGMATLLRTPFLQPRSITLTIRHADWWYWESDNPLSFEGTWIKNVCSVMPNTVSEIHIELESLERKMAQVDEIAKQMAHRWYFKRADGGVLYADNREGAAEVSRWTGSSTWHNQRWVRDENPTAPGEINYYIVTVSFRLATALERRGGWISDKARENAARNRSGASMRLHIPDAEPMECSNPSIYIPPVSHSYDANFLVHSPTPEWLGPDDVQVIGSPVLESNEAPIWWDMLYGEGQDQQEPQAGAEEQGQQQQGHPGQSTS